MLRIPGAGAFSPSSPDLRCESRPETLTFDYEVPWNSVGTDPELALTAWMPETVPDHEISLKGAAFSPDGTRAAILLPPRPSPSLPMALKGHESPGEETLLMWSAGDPDSKPLRHPSPVLSAVFSGDGTRLLPRAQDGVRIWRI